MKVVDLSKETKLNNPFSVLTVGTFDGVHKGHQKIINKLVNVAKRNNAESVLVTFQPHPRTVIFPDDSSLVLINTLEEKLRLLEKNGIDKVILMPFTKKFSQLTSCEFIKQYVYEKFNAKHLIVGYDHRFGKDRLGDVEKLKECTKPYGIDVEKVCAYTQNGENVSSTKIRNAIGNGKITVANKFLSYKYNMSGMVVKGKRIGRKIGFPTANILFDKCNKPIPKNGVYSVDVKIESNIYSGMLNIGTNPTVNKNRDVNIEVNIFNFNSDIYNKNIKIYFNKFIRDEIKFNNLTDLHNQLVEDKKKILHL